MFVRVRESLFFYNKGVKDVNEEEEEEEGVEEVGEVDFPGVAAGLTGTIEEGSGETTGDAMAPNWSAGPVSPEYKGIPTKLVELCLDLFEVVTTVCELREFCDDLLGIVLSVSPVVCGTGP